MELWRKYFLGRCLFLKLLVLKLQNFKNLLHLLDSTIIIKRLLLPQSRFVRAQTLATPEVSTSICQNKCRLSSLTYVGSGPTLTLFIHNSRHSLSHLLSSIYSTFIHTTPGFHLHHTYMKCLDSLYFSCITCFSVGCFFPNNCNKFLPIFFTFYLSCFPPFPSLCLLFLFCFHSHLAYLSPKPTSSVLSKGMMGWEGCNGDRAVISNFPYLRPLSMWLNMTFQGCYSAFVNYLFCKDLFCIKQDVSNQPWHQSHFPVCCISR